MCLATPVSSFVWGFPCCNSGIGLPTSVKGLPIFLINLNSFVATESDRGHHGSLTRPVQHLPTAIGPAGTQCPVSPGDMLTKLSYLEVCLSKVTIMTPESTFSQVTHGGLSSNL